jgi:hypothetical protein
LDPTTDPNTMLASLEKHKINVDIGNFDIELMMSNGKTDTMTIFDSFVFLYSKISEYFKVHGHLSL